MAAAAATSGWFCFSALVIPGAWVVCEAKYPKLLVMGLVSLFTDILIWVMVCAWFGKAATDYGVFATWMGIYAKHINVDVNAELGKGWRLVWCGLGFCVAAYVLLMLEFLHDKDDKDVPVPDPENTPASPDTPAAEDSSQKNLLAAADDGVQRANVMVEWFAKLGKT